MPAIDTTRVKDRRSLRFNSLDDLQSDVAHLIDLDRAGRLQQLGNWTLGQTLGHLATWMNYSYEPNPLKPPLLIRLIFRTMKERVLYGQMRAGVKIPKVEGGTLGVEPLSTDEGLRRFEASIDRLRRDTPTQPSVIFGVLTHDEAIALNLRHAENHLSFFKEMT